MFDSIKESINEFLMDTISSIMNFAVGIAKAIVDQLNENIPTVNTWYNVFLAFATSLVVAVVIGRIITTLLKEADATTDATWVTIVVDCLKSAAAIPVMVFLQKFIQTKFTIPLAKAMFDMEGDFSAKAIKGTTEIYTGINQTGNAIKVGVGMTILFLLFFCIVAVIFFVKMSIFVADMAWYTLSIPLTAMSIATESFDYASTWWKKLIYYNISMLSQVLSLTICIYCFTNLSNLGVIGFMGSIGFGFLVIHTPHVIQDFWASTGVTRGAGRFGMRQMANMMAKRH